MNINQACRLNVSKEEQCCTLHYCTSLLTIDSHQLMLCACDTTCTFVITTIGKRHHFNTSHSPGHCPLSCVLMWATFREIHISLWCIGISKDSLSKSKPHCLGVEINGQNYLLDSLALFYISSYFVHCKTSLVPGAISSAASTIPRISITRIAISIAIIPPAALTVRLATSERTRHVRGTTVAVLVTPAVALPALR